MTNRVSYIFRYKESGEVRTKALMFVLTHVRKLFPDMEIIVVEQENSTLNLPKEWNIRVIFDDYEGVFNSCRPFNIGAKAATRDILVFSDTDIFLKKEDFLTLLEAMKDFEAVTPNKNYLNNVEITDLEQHEFTLLNVRSFYTFGGGWSMMRKSAFKKIGGWDERFIGWGHEDVVYSHLVFQKLISKSFYLPWYHIDHPRKITDTDQHDHININANLKEEIETFHGQALDNYVRILQAQQTPQTKSEKPKFVLAVIADHAENVKNLLLSFEKTRAREADWTVILAENGSTVETDFLPKDINLIRLKKSPFGILRQENQILKKLSELPFDCCFKCSDEITFRQKGWDTAYWQAVQRTGYDTLIFNSQKNFVPSAYLSFPIHFGDLSAHCPPQRMELLFYTLTPRVLKTVGFMDEQRLKKSTAGSLDYLFRCCRMGFNVLSYPFDIKNSSDFIGLQNEESYAPRIRFQKLYFKTKQILLGNRGFLPYGENDFMPSPKSEAAKPNEIKKIKGVKEVKKKAVKKASFERIPYGGITGSTLRMVGKTYNFAVVHGWKNIPKKIKNLGQILISVGLYFKEIDR